MYFFLKVMALTSDFNPPQGLGYYLESDIVDICQVLGMDLSFVQKVRRELQASGMNYEMTVT